MHATNIQAHSIFFWPKPLPLNNPGLPGIMETTVLTVSKQTTEDLDPKEEKTGGSREGTKQPVSWKLSDRIIVK